MMIQPTQLEIFRVLAPEFDEIDDDRVIQNLDLYGDMVSKKRFGRWYDRATVLLTAHYLKIADMMASDDAGSATSAITAGGIVMEKEGDLQRQYGGAASGGTSATAASGLLRKTAYGLMFLELQSHCIVPVMTRMG